MEEEVKKGLEGVVAAESKLAFIDGNLGKLLYRGYNINDLAQYSSYEEVVYLLLYGKLPTKQELRDFTKQLSSQRQLQNEIFKLMKTFAKNSDSMDALRTSVSLISNYDSDLSNLSMEKNLERSISLIAKFPTFVTAAYRIKKGLKPIKPKSKFSQAANFLYMLHGEPPDGVSVKALDTDFILHAEHGFNASTFAARVTISTLSDMYASIVSAIGTLKGPLHGGAAVEVFDMLKKIGKVENVESYVENALARKEKIMGFGHRVYKTIDPRAIHLKKMSKQLAERTSNFHYFNISEKLEETVVPLLKEKKIYPNVDFYSPTVYNNLKISEELFGSIFAVSRIAGWVAHVLEQLSDNRLIRPIEKYTGNFDLVYAPINKR